jgi:uridine kinase
MTPEEQLEVARQAVEKVSMVGSPLGSDHDAWASVAVRRWNSSQRRNVEPDDYDGRIEDLVKGLIQQFEPDPDLVGPLIEDYRFLARRLAQAFEPKPSADIDDVITEIDFLSRRRTPVIVAIDGMSAAGKSTLAAEIKERRDVAIVHGDDFYRVMDDTARFELSPQAGYEQYFDWQRLLSEALSALRQNRTASFRRYDWTSGQLGERVNVGPSPVVVVEGVYTMRPELSSMFDMTVWLDTSDELRAERRSRRDDPPEWVDRWDRAERYYISTFQPQLQADFTFRGQ